MKRVGWIAVAVMLVSVSAWADQAVDKRLPAKPDGIVEIDNVSGSVEIVGWDRDEVHVEGTLERNVTRMDFESHNGRTRINVVVPKLGRWRHKSAFLTIHVPEKSCIRVEVTSARAEVKDVWGSMDIETVSGEVNVAVPPRPVEPREEDAKETGEGPRERVVKEIEAESVSGKVTISAVAGEMTLETVSGDVKVAGKVGKLEAGTTSGRIAVSAAVGEMNLESVSGDMKVSGEVGALQAETTSGDIAAGVVRHEVKVGTISGEVEVKGGELKSVEIDTTSGEQDFRGGLAAGGRMDLSSQSGDITIEFTSSPSAEFDLETNSGDFKIDLGPVSFPSSKGLGEKSVRFVKDGGASSVSVETGSGDITISKR